MSELLKPCPFCSGKNIMSRGFPWAYLRCEDCNACAGSFENKENAVNAWNTRADDKRIAELKAQVDALEEALRHPARLMQKEYRDLWQKAEAKVDAVREAHKIFAASVALLPVKSAERETGMSWLRLFEQALEEQNDAM